MDQAAREEVQRRLEELAAARFPDGALERVRMLHYGDDPEVEPGEMMARIMIPAADHPGGQDHPADGEVPEPGEEPLEAFHQAYRGAIDRFREDIQRFPGVTHVEFVHSGDEHAHRLRLAFARRPTGEPGGEMTPVMARLGPADLETLDTLITTGIAANRADAVRWTLARIRERPAYGELRERARQIEELKTQF
jgi:hypothetical protein